MKRLRSALIACLVLIPCRSWAASRVEGDLGASSVMTSTQGDIFECDDQHIERRLNASLKPIWTTREMDFMADANGIAVVPQSGRPQVFDSGLNLDFKRRSGLHQSSLSASGKYQDQIVRYGCSSELEKRLRRKREVEDGAVLAGRSLKTYAAAIEHQIGKASDKLTARYAWTKSLANGFDQRHELSLRLDHVLSQSGAVYGGVFVSNIRGDLDDFVNSGASSGGAFRIDPRFVLSGEVRTEIRNDNSRAFNGSGSAAYKIDALSDLYSRISQTRYFHEERSSILDSELGARSRSQWTNVGVAVHRINLSRGDRSVGLWYSAEVQRKIGDSQNVEVKMSTGSPYPDQVSEVTTLACAYGLVLGDPSLSLQFTPEQRAPRPTLSINIGYSQSRLIDLLSRTMATRQWVWSIKAVF